MPLLSELFMTAAKKKRYLSIFDHDKQGISTISIVSSPFLREEIYSKRLVVSKLDRESKSLYNNVKSN